MADERCDLLCLDLSRAEKLRHERRRRGDLAELSAAAAALADPTRLAVAVALLEEPELCGCDLAWVVERSQALVSHHVGTLREAGLLSSRREGRMVMHALTERGTSLVRAALGTEMGAPT